jgi:hypothetical protein
MTEYGFRDLELSEELLSITDPKEHSIITDYEFDDIGLSEELLNISCHLEGYND